MRSIEITINGTITIKANDDAKVKHHHDNNRQHTTNKNGSRMIPEKVLPSIKGHEGCHPDSRVELFFAHGECDNAVTAHELIIHYGKIFALDIFTLKGIEAKSVATTYGTIVPDGKGGIKLFSDQHKRWYPCSVQNSVYSIKNLISDARKYDL